MSKVFITKNGQFLSRGGGVLTQVENPDLEVNDIGVEVSEKIAEDVKEGDLVFKYRESVVELGPGIQTRGDAGFQNDNRFFEFQGDLYYWDLDYRTFGIYKYENGEWINHLSKENLEAGLSNFFRGGPLLSTEDAVYSFETQYFNRNFPPYIICKKFVGNTVFDINPFWEMDSSALPQSDTYISNGETLHRQVDSIQVIEASGVVHLAVGTRTDLSSSNPFWTYTFDKTTEKLTPTTADLSSTYAYDNSIPKVTFYEFNGSLFLIEHHNDYSTTPRANLYKWNPSTNNWDHHQQINANHVINQATYAEFDGELWFLMVTAQGGNGNLQIWKHNNLTDELEFVTYFNDQRPDLTVGWTFSVYSHLFKDSSGNGYIIANPLTNYGGDWRGEEYIALYKLNTDTSTVSYVTSGGLGFYTHPDHSYIGNSLNLYTHDGITHISTQRNISFGELLCFSKWDPSTSSLSRNVEWKSPRKGNWVVASLEFIESSGVSYAVQTGEKAIAYTFEPSSGEFIHDVYFDIGPQYGYWTHLYESNGTVYMLSTKPSWSSPGYYIYELDASAKKFNKLADTSSITTNGTGTSDFIQFSGVNYLTVGNRTASPYLSVYTVSGNNLEDISPSTLPPGRLNWPNSTGFYEYNNELFMFASTDTNETTDNSILFYKLEGSSTWIDVPHTPAHTEITLLDCRGGTFYSTSSGLYFIGLFSHNRGIAHFKYDGSSFVPEYDGLQTVYGAEVGFYNIESATVDNVVYVFLSRSGAELNRSYGRANLLVKYPDKGWIRYPVANEVSNLYNRMTSFKDKPYIIVSNDGADDWSSTYTLSEFFGEEVWKKKQYPNKIAQPTLAYGIALQDGSKGDIIKIRRIKR